MKQASFPQALLVHLHFFNDFEDVINMFSNIFSGRLDNGIYGDIIVINANLPFR